MSWTFTDEMSAREFGSLSSDAQSFASSKHLSKNKLDYWLSDLEYKLEPWREEYCPGSFKKIDKLIARIKKRKGSRAKKRALGLLGDALYGFV